MRPAPRATGVLLAVALSGALAGCGKAALRHTASSAGGPSPSVAPLAAPGAVSVVTKNTVRLGGSEPAADAAAVARAAYPGLTSSTRPQAVVIVDEHNWAASLAASVLAGAPLRAPLLYAEGSTLPEVSRQALEAMHPTGAAVLAGAQVILVGTSAGLPGEYRSRTVAVSASSPAASAASVERILPDLRSARARQVIIVAAEASRAVQMPAAGLAAESGAPILYASAGGVPRATGAILSTLGRPSLYVLGFPSVPRPTLRELSRFGPVTPIAGASSANEGATPVGNSIAVARFTDGVFGWGIKEPGHGLVFANEARPLDAPAAALLSNTGQYGPLLLLDGPVGLAPPLVRYLSDIQPAYGRAPQYQPVHGAYNHGWLIGDEGAISAATQAELDAMLEIVPAKAASEESSALTPNEPTPTSIQMSEAEDPTRLARARETHEVTVEDVRQLMGASTPHFALQLRNRIAKLIADLPPEHPARIEGEREIARLERLGLAGEVRGEGPHYDEPPLPSLSLDAVEHEPEPV